VGWYLKTLHDSSFRAFFNQLETPQQQLTAIHEFFENNNMMKEQAA
jgi:hypothetical protein